MILDYPFAYCHDIIKPYIDTAFFVDTPLDISLARRILRDMSDATADEIRHDLEMYLTYARIAFIQMQKDILPSSDYVIDGTLSVEEIIITEGIPFEVKPGRLVYSAEEEVNEVRATMAFEDMDLTEEDVWMLYAYKNGDVLGDALRREILGGAK